MSDLTEAPAPDESGPDECRIDPGVVAALFVNHADELRRFLTGILRNHELANDVLQVTFARAVERGHTAREESLKAWLFRVGFNEAIAVKRRQTVQAKANDILAARGPKDSVAPDMRLTRWETVEQVRGAMEQLPPEQCQVVRMRIYEEKKFVEIAAELNLPLGTVLTRMQLALRKLKKLLEPDRP